MAEKKSILGGLKNMLHRDSGKTPEPAPKPAAPAKKKAAAAKESAKKPPATTPPADAPAAPEAKSEKKAKDQPWYRHRQRW